ncbi:MAG: hypothetical protein QM697_05925 [Lachnospiraceae bacterium]
MIKQPKEEKDINSFAFDNNIKPNLLRNWKKEFLNNESASVRRQTRGKSQ